MEKRVYLGPVLLSLVVGFIGGIGGSLLVNGPPVSADAGDIINARAMHVLGPDGKLRLQLATYDGSYAVSEKGQPLVALTDNSGRLRMLLRLAGSNESPVIVFKDQNKRDRLVIGLGLNDSEEDPFIAYFDKAGRKHTLLGNY